MFVFLANKGISLVFDFLVSLLSKFKAYIGKEEQHVPPRIGSIKGKRKKVRRGEENTNNYHGRCAKSVLDFPPLPKVFITLLKIAASVSACCYRKKFYI
jgi:hypothetical protein